MGFLTKMFSATVKTVLTPVAIVKDAANILTGEDADATKSLLQSATEDVFDALDDLGDGDAL